MADEIDAFAPHEFILCLVEHLFPREPHCDICGEAQEHPLHAVTEVV